MKVVINNCFGGFSVSRAGRDFLAGRGYRENYDFENEEGPLSRWSSYCRDIKRDDPRLVQMVEELGAEGDGAHAELKVVEIPDGVSFGIDEYDGLESIHEEHRSWS